VKTRGLVLLGGTVVLCLLLLTLQVRQQSSAAGDVLGSVTAPFQAALTRAGQFAFGLWSTYREWKDVRAENVHLRDEIRQLRVSTLQVDETAEENRRLRGLLALQERLPLRTRAAEIIAREWGGWVRSLTINHGRRNGVERLTAVITADGLVGRVAEVRIATAIVQVLTDPGSTVGAHVVRTRTSGIVEGEARGTMRFKFMARDGAGLRVRDLVVTSGIGGLFPSGIPIGRIRAIDDRGSALFHFAPLTPAVDLSRLEEVLLVMRGGRNPDLTALFRSDENEK
jgi:rod shape-determining protein MreC